MKRWWRLGELQQATCSAIGEYEGIYDENGINTVGLLQDLVQALEPVALEHKILQM